MDFAVDSTISKSLNSRTLPPSPLNCLRPQAAPWRRIEFWSKWGRISCSDIRRKPIRTRSKCSSTTNSCILRMTTETLNGSGTGRGSWVALTKNCSLFSLHCHWKELAGHFARLSSATKSNQPWSPSIRQIVSVFRKQLKDQKFTRFEELLIALENEDKKCEGKVHADDVRKVISTY